MISLFLKLYDWATYQKQKGAIKLHTMLDYDRCMPCYLFVRPGEYSDLSFAKNLVLKPNSIIMLDRGYQDFSMFHRWHREGVTFVTRLKSKILHERLRENAPSPGDPGKILVDEVIRLTGKDGSGKYPDELRRVVIYDQAHKDTIEVLTNNFFWTANTIIELYWERWNIEKFFRYLKQNLKIKSFLGRSENAVFTQIWTALIAFLLLSLLKKRASFNWHLSNLLHFIRLNLFNRFDLYEWLNNPIRPLVKKSDYAPSLFSS